MDLTFYIKINTFIHHSLTTLLQFCYSKS